MGTVVGLERMILYLSRNQNFKRVKSKNSLATLRQMLRTWFMLIKFTQLYLLPGPWLFVQWKAGPPPSWPHLSTHHLNLHKGWAGLQYSHHHSYIRRSSGTSGFQAQSHQITQALHLPDSRETLLIRYEMQPPQQLPRKAV